MSTFGTLNNRELSLIIWLIIAVLWVFVFKNTRKIAFGALKIFFDKQIFLPFLAMTAYMSLAILGLRELNLWNLSLTKDTVFWFFGTGLVFFIDINNFIKGKTSIRKVVFDTFAVVAILKFVFDLFPYSLLIELALVPTLFVLIAMWEFSKINEELKPAEKLLGFIVSAIGIFFIISALYNLALNFQTTLTARTIYLFFFPFFLTLAYIPYLYFLSLYAVYQTLFLRINLFMNNRDKALANYIKQKILLHFNFNVHIIAQIEAKYFQTFHITRNKEEVMNVIRTLKSPTSIHWRFVIRWFVQIFLILTLLLAIPFVIKLLYSISWIGFGDYETPTGEFVRGKTIWDWMELVFIPLVLLFAARYYSDAQRRTELERTHRIEQASILQNYLDRMQNLVLEHQLLDSETDHSVSVMATILTRNTLSRLDSENKSPVLRFLDGTGLIKSLKVSMSGMSLNGIGQPISYAQGHFVEGDFRFADLTDAQFDMTDFSYADLMGVMLEHSKLMYCNFEATNLEGAFLNGSNFLGSQFSTETKLPNGDNWKPDTDWSQFGVIFEEPYTESEYQETLHKLGYSEQQISQTRSHRSSDEG